MTPLELRLLVAIGVMADWATEEFRDTEVHNYALEQFHSKGLTDSPSTAAALTPKGRAYIQLLLDTPIPEEKTAFIDPRTGAVIDEVEVG